MTWITIPPGPASTRALVMMSGMLPDALVPICVVDLMHFRRPGETVELMRPYVFPTPVPFKKEVLEAAYRGADVDILDVTVQFFELTGNESRVLGLAIHAGMVEEILSRGWPDPCSKPRFQVSIGGVVFCPPTETERLGWALQNIILE